ncbi:hypothetical protein BGW36DRAFT_82243 [Talaromyces proteolyticus]|uniref:Xylanolytic transcriptional activator regulatory domain-containing protein n=1 Tax=Talaromyces proteolyticus TaxID=1131652 RepID=A0AAD4Q4B4_9EURO|nr:uncharacterized protein BGW36DRAFT_82243 [Talaromyces proteolyticus]KAH8703056.1 hypothetical protein BGW36DRAFT_82243 [Talaromyces proteolyticus]
MEDLETQIFHHLMNPFPPREGNEDPLVNSCNANSASRVADHSHFRLYSKYPFAKLDGLEHLSMKDRALLELQGCFYLPAQPQFDDFLVHYFRHIHPYLPMLDETNFWQIYSDVGSGTQRENSTISLFVLQAMLFAAAGIVDHRTITALGFIHYEEARDTFYERAKILFELQAESNPYSIAQGTLLLSYRFAIDNPLCNVNWLQRAISNARKCGAHLQKSEKPDKNLTTAMNTKAMQYRRLWCSCIIRDRILSLGVRTRLLIPPNEFNPTHDLLNEQDLNFEVSASRVYSVSSKQTLLYLSIKVSRLSGILTEIVTLAEDIKDMLRGLSMLAMKDLPNIVETVKRVSNQLDTWETTSLDQILQQRGDPSVMSHTILAYIYYQSARIRLVNAQVMLLEVQSQEVPPEIQLNERHAIKIKLERSVHAIVGFMKTAVKYDITGHWPISIGAHTFFPAMLLYINRMLPATPLEMVNRVDGYRDAYTVMRSSNARHGSSEKILQHLTATLEEDLEALIFTGHEETASVADWSDLVVHFPHIYLKLVLILENFFERGVVV